MRRLCLAAALGCILLPWAPARAHGPAEWIERGRFTNAVGQLCCGERGCLEVPSSDVEVTARGFYIRSLKETVPFDEAQPSPDGHYWRCAWGGERKCFFAPPPST